MGRIILIVVVLLIVILIACILGWYIRTYNNIQVTRLKVKEGLSGIDVALTKRYDVLTKMLDTVRKCASEILEIDPRLNLEEHKELKQSVNSLFKKLSFQKSN